MKIRHYGWMSGNSKVSVEGGEVVGLARPWLDVLVGQRLRAASGTVDRADEVSPVWRCHASDRGQLHLVVVAGHPPRAWADLLRQWVTHEPGK